VKVGGDLDEYSATVAYLQNDFGQIKFTTAGDHKVRLTVTGKNASSTVYTLAADRFLLTPAADAWLDDDIGAVGLAGSFSQSSGTYTIAGSGTDIWSTADQFHYAWQNVSGDVDIIARVAGEDQTSSYAKAGVMIRASLATNSVNACVMLTPTNGVSMQVRSATGASSINVAGWVRSATPPQFVKLSRVGSTFTASYSADGSSWTQIASTNVTMSAGATVGMAVTAHNNAALNTATFDNVDVR
jgi:regulation of enolase protein 1 (concanavalin A-like superfamily)